jgi:hypothetical protein
MHDWTLVSIQTEWKEGRVALSFRNSKSETVSVIADGIAELVIPRRNEWGPSVSVNSVIGPTDHQGGLQRLSIEMQSGDVIQIVAKSFCLPTG